jgi:hypothetical protein
MVLHFGLAAEAQALLGAFGYGWSDSGFANYDLWLQAFSEVLPNFNVPGEVVYHRLLVYLVLPKTAGLDAEFSSWVASPAELAQIEHDSPWNFDFAYQGILHVAAEAFLRAGRYDDAAEAARIAVSPEHQTREHVTLAECHKVLGQVAAKRGDSDDEVNGHFTRALGAARASKYAMLEVLIAESWKVAVGGEKHGTAVAAGADAAIDEACAKMGKTREQIFAHR